MRRGLILGSGAAPLSGTVFPAPPDPEWLLDLGLLLLGLLVLERERLLDLDLEVDDSIIQKSLSWK